MLSCTRFILVKQPCAVHMLSLCLCVVFYLFLTVTTLTPHPHTFTHTHTLSLTKYRSILKPPLGLYSSTPLVYPHGTELLLPPTPTPTPTPHSSHSVEQRYVQSHSKSFSTTLFAIYAVVSCLTLFAVVRIILRGSEISRAPVFSKHYPSLHIALLYSVSSDTSASVPRV
jgi:hypothetical protein